MSQRTEGVDVGYWESLLSQLKAHLARARLRDKHSESLRRKLEKLKNEQGIEDHEEAVEEVHEDKEEDIEPDEHVDNEEETNTESSEEMSLIDNALQDYAAGSYRFVFTGITNLFYNIFLDLRHGCS